MWDQVYLHSRDTHVTLSSPHLTIWMLWWNEKDPGIRSTEAQRGARGFISSAPVKLNVMCAGNISFFLGHSRGQLRQAFPFVFAMKSNPVLSLHHTYMRPLEWKNLKMIWVYTCVVWPYSRCKTYEMLWQSIRKQLFRVKQDCCWNRTEQRWTALIGSNIQSWNKRGENAIRCGEYGAGLDLCIESSLWENFPLCVLVYPSDFTFGLSAERVPVFFLSLHSC